MKLSLTVLAVTLLASMPVAAAPFTNGSFETAPVNSNGQGYTELFAINNSIPGWTVTVGSVDWIRGGWNPSQGLSSLDLSGRASGTIQQSFDTTSGQVYNVLFDMAGNPDGGVGTKQLSVSTDGILFAPFTFTVGVGNTTANMGWQERGFSFTATSATTTLTFRSDENSPYGAALDNVRVSALTVIPEPATLAVFGGIALAGAFGYRRRTATAPA